MSYVATTVVLVSYYEDEKDIRAACEPFSDQGVSLIWASAVDSEAAGEVWGGSKWPESDVLLGAFNYLNREELIEHLKATLKEPFTVCFSEEGRTRAWEIERYGI